MLVSALLRTKLLQLAQPISHRGGTHGIHGHRPRVSNRENKYASSLKTLPGDLRRNGHGGQLHYFHFTGTVSFVDGNRMAVVLPDMEALSHLREDGRIGVQLYLDETTYRLMFEALDRVSAARLAAWPNCATFFTAQRRPDISPSNRYVSLG